MVAVVLPVGFYVGQVFASPSATEPDFHQVRLGDDIMQIAPNEHAVWALAHGDPDRLAAGAEANRQALTASAKELGFDTITEETQALQELGLLTQFMQMGSAKRRFAETHRVAPLTLGLGSPPGDDGMFEIGEPSQPRLSLAADIYNVWVFGARHRSLWSACTTLAPRLNVTFSEETRYENISAGVDAAGNVVDGPEVAASDAPPRSGVRAGIPGRLAPNAASSPGDAAALGLLDSFLQALPMLLAVGGAYLDRAA